jgi:hypothetical protein
MNKAHAVTLFFAMTMALPAFAQENAADLAKKLANPIANLISVPLQYNYDADIGPDEDGTRSQLKIQPVIPITLNDEWNVISRTIVPVTYQDDIYPGAGDQFGLSDTTQSFFFSPKAPSSDGWIWGVGPAILIPTGTDDELGAGQWGVGPTFVVLKQESGWTYGMLANQIWGVAGSDRLPDVDQLFLQPFLSFTTKTLWTYSLNTESTYDWQAEEWSVPFNAVAQKLVKIGRLPIQFGLGARYWADAPDDQGPENFGLRAQVTFLFPK